VATEHSAVLDPCRYLQSLGFEVTVLPVDRLGLLDLEELAQAMRPETVLVSVMVANNEIGVLQPIEQIGALCRDRGVLFHTDAAQAIGKVPLDVQTQSIDLMSLTAHKVYGPKGIGALYVRRGNSRVALAPQLHGGGQERGLRAGTLPVSQIVGFGRAIELAMGHLATEAEKLQMLRDRLWERLQTYFATAPGLDLELNGHPSLRLPGNLNVTIEGLPNGAVLKAIQSIAAVSSGSACQSETGRQSHVLKALGQSAGPLTTTLRFGLGRFHDFATIDRVATRLIGAIEQIRRNAGTLA
jgi:cysteine desulfurase